MAYSFRSGKRKKKDLKATVKRMTRPRTIVGSGKAVKSGIKKMRNDELHIRAFKNIVDSFSFKKIFVIWIAMILVFGVVYYIIGSVSPGNGLSGTVGSGIDEFMDSLYFSFITATSTGFGDISPLGMSRLVSVIEVIAGLTMFGILISKLVSFKQEVIISEIYDISFGERVNRLRSGLYLFRSDIENITERMSRGRMNRTLESSIISAFNNLHETMIDIRNVVCARNAKSEYVKKVDELQLELVLNSVRLSLTKLKEFLEHIDSGSHEWRTEKNRSKVRSILSVTDEIIGYHTISGAPESVTKRIGQIALISRDIKAKM